METDMETDMHPDIYVEAKVYVLVFAPLNYDWKDNLSIIKIGTQPNAHLCNCGRGKTCTIPPLALHSRHASHSGVSA
jgi:hypothetical protein